MIYSKRFRLIVFTLTSLLLQTAISTTAGPVPDTMQTTSYTDTYGEDSDYTINPPSYTKLAFGGIELIDTATFADGWIMTRDNVTGLIWEVKTDDGSIHDKDNTYTWCDTEPTTNGGSQGTCGDGTDTEDFIAVLNSGSFGGFSDWRIPTRRELRSIVHYQNSNPSIDVIYFPNTVHNYWSSNTLTDAVFGAWAVYFDLGYDYGNSKSYSFYVRAVRGRPKHSISKPTIVNNGDGTVTDTKTGIMWQQQDDGTPRTWESAISFCENLSLAGYDDWRLPTIKELDSIANIYRHNPSINPNFIRTASSYYWTSTTLAYISYYAWHILFNDSSNSSSDKSSSYYVRAVRGGQNQIAGHLFISTPNQADVLMVGETANITWETQSISGDVSIVLSRDGGKTFSAVISDATPNDGSFEWVVNGKGSYNCMLKIIPLSDPDMSTTQGLFSIESMNAMPHIPLLLLSE